MKRVLLLDTDIIAYEITSGHEKRVDWDGDGNIDQIVPDISVIHRECDKEVRYWEGRLKGHPIICLSCDSKDNFRKDFYPAYKENRKGQLRPLQLIAAKQYLATEYESFARPRLEADDVMGILSTNPKLFPQAKEKVIVSIDKDMKTIPGWLFNPAKDKWPRLVSQEEADRFHLYQTLAGDAVDGYPGCPGIGPKKAERALEEHGAYWGTVVGVYEGRGFTAEDALAQARCARILRHCDYDYSTKQPIPWEPSDAL